MLEARVRAPTTLRRDMLRARIVLLAAEGHKSRAIGRALKTVPGSWLDRIEIWFSILSGATLRGASFTSPQQLRQAIDAFIAAYNQKAASFRWTKAEVPQKTLKPPIGHL